MPHVLWELQGTQDASEVRAPTRRATREALQGVRARSRPGELTPEEYDAFVRDTVNFLDYIGEPIQRERQALGFRVIAFLLVFTLLAYLLEEGISGRTSTSPPVRRACSPPRRHLL